jgi:hypothetical protein
MDRERPLEVFVCRIVSLRDIVEGGNGVEGHREQRFVSGLAVAPKGLDVQIAGRGRF